MELHALNPPDLPAPLPDLERLAAEGEIARLHRGPVSVDQALGLGLARMLAEDEAEARERDPVAWVRAHRPPSLLRRLLRGR